MTAPGLIIAAPRSGAGKTTVTLALLAAFRRRGLAVQAAKAGPDYIDPAFHEAATGRPSFNLDSWAMPPALLDALVARGRSGGRSAGDRRRDGPVRRHSRRARAGPAPRPTSPPDFGLPVLLVIDVAGQSQSAAAVRARLRRARSGGQDRRRGAEPGRQRAPRQAGGRGDRARSAFRSSVRSRATRRSHCRSGISAWCRRASMAISPCGSNAWPTWPSIISISTRILRVAAPPQLVGQLGVPRCRRRERASRWRRTKPSASSTRMSSPAGVGPGPRSRHSRRWPTRRRPSNATRCWLPGGYPELHAGRLAAAEKFMRRAGALRRDTAGAWRVRWLHGARRKPRGRRRRSAPHGRPARPCHQLRSPQASSRLSPGAAIWLTRRLERRARVLRGHEFHYAAMLSAGNDAPLVELADGEGKALGPAGGRRGSVTGTFFHAIAPS